MTEQTNEIVEVEASTGSPESSQGNAGKMKLLIIIGGVVVLLIIIGVVLFLTPLGKSLFGHKEEAAKKEEKVAAPTAKPIDPKNLSFIVLPDILVNLRAKAGKGKFLKISLTLELENAKDKDLIEGLKPRIIDQFQVFLRELEIEDLTGSGALERLRHELVARVNNICAPTKVADVLFKEMLVQ